MLLALAIVLELISKAIIPEMPFGGQVTLVAMLPVVLISYRYGVKWGFVSGFCYALLEMALGAKTVSAAFQPRLFRRRHHDLQGHPHVPAGLSARLHHDGSGRHFPG